MCADVCQEPIYDPMEEREYNHKMAQFARGFILVEGEDAIAEVKAFWKEMVKAGLASTNKMYEFLLG